MLDVAAIAGFVPRLDFAAGERFDFAPPVRLGATPVEIRPDGYRVYKGVATFGDVVLEYPDLDPPRAEFRPIDEVLSPRALASMVGVPFTLQHPEDLLDENTVRDHMHGAVLSAERGGERGDEMHVLLIVHTAEGQDAIESGALQELSPGYRAREDKTSGVHKGKRYDVVQRGHLYNHLAGVDMARARTPDGRVAKLDAAALAYPRASEQGQSIMPPIETDADDLTPHNDAAPDADAPPATDGDKPKADNGEGMMLSDDDMALLKQMSPEGQALVMGLISGESAEAKAMEAAAMAAGAAAEGAGAEVMPDDAAPPMAGAAAPAVAALDAAAIKQMVADAVAAAMKDAKAAAPAMSPDEEEAEEEGEEMADKKDRAAAVIASARDAATRAYNDAAALTEHVRKDGHPNIAGADSAAVTALTVIDGHLPALKTDAEAHYKAGRMDAFLRIYDAAEKVRRDSILDEQGARIAAVFRSESDAAGGGFVLPPTHVRSL